MVFLNTSPHNHLKSWSCNKFRLEQTMVKATKKWSGTIIKINFYSVLTSLTIFIALLFAFYCFYQKRYIFAADNWGFSSLSLVGNVDDLLNCVIGANPKCIICCWSNWRFMHCLILNTIFWCFWTLCKWFQWLQIVCWLCKATISSWKMVKHKYLCKIS